MTGSSAGASQVARMVPTVELARVILPMSRESRGDGGSSIAIVFWSGGMMVTFAESAAVRAPSRTVSVKVTIVSEFTCGAVNVADGAVRSARVMFREGSWDHR